MLKRFFLLCLLVVLAVSSVEILSNSTLVTASSQPVALDTIRNISSNTPEPTASADPTLIKFSGRGDDVTSIFTLTAGIATVTMFHDGNSRFAVKLLGENGGNGKLLLSKYGNFEGTAALAIDDGNAIGMEPGNYVMEVSADGNWTIEIRQPEPLSGKELPASFTGKSYGVSDFFILKQGIATFSFTYDGTSSFAVHLFSSDSRESEELVNEFGPYEGKKAIGINKENGPAARPGIFMLYVEAEGSWTVSISQ